MDIGCRNPVVRGARYDTSPRALEELFEPLAVPESARPGRRILCARTGHTATVMGVAQVLSRPALFVHIDDFTGSVPFIGDASYTERWRAIPASAPPPAQPGAIVCLPSLVGFPLQPAFTLLCAPAVDLLAPLALAGIEPLSTVAMPERKNTELELIGAAPEGGYVARVVRSNDPSLEEIVLLPPGTTVRVMSRRRRFTIAPAPPHVTLGAPPDLPQSAKTKVVDEDPRDPLVCTFPWLRGVERGSVYLFDADPARCRRYFGIVPGQKVALPTPSIAIGMGYSRGKVEMWFWPEDKDGAGTFGSGTELVFNGYQALKPRLLPHPMLAPRPVLPQRVRRGQTIVVPQVTPPPPGVSLARYVTPFGVVAIYREGAQSFGLRHGQYVLDKDDDAIIVLGVGLDPRDGKAEFWCLLNNTVVVVGATHKLTPTDDFAAPIAPNGDDVTEVVYQSVKTATCPVKFQTTFPILYGKNKVTRVTIDPDPARCRQVFGISPGQCIDGNCVAMGVGLKGDDWVLVCMSNGHAGAGTFSPGDKIYVSARQVPLPTQAIRFIEAGPKPVRRGDEPDERFMYMIGATVPIPKRVDADPERCRRYFDVTPGQRVDNNTGTVIGIKRDGDKVLLFVHLDESRGAGTYREADAKLQIDEERIEVEELFISPIHEFTVRTVNEDPADPLVPTFAFRNGLDTLCAVLCDVDRDRCLRYAGVAPGQRFSGECTFVGLFHDGTATPARVRMLFSPDSQVHGGTFEDGTLLIKDADTQPVERYTHHWVLPHPKGPYRTFTVPALAQVATAYNMCFQYWFRPERANMFDNTPATLGKMGLRFGQRGVLNSLRLTVIGVGLDTDGKYELFMQVDGGGVSPITAGSNFSLSNDVVEPPPLEATLITVDQPAERDGLRVRPTTPVRIGIRLPTRVAFLDTDPTRVKAYFGVVPGQRADGNATIIGMRKEDGVVKLFGTVDKLAGAGSWGKGTKLLVGARPVRLDLQRREHGRASYEEAMMFQPTSAVGAGGDSDIVADEFRYSWKYPLQYEANMAAVRFVTSAAYDVTAKNEVTRRLAQMGAEDVEMTLFNAHTFLQREVPIVSWFTPFKVVGERPIAEIMTDDVAMRTLFELSHGNGSKNQEARGGWETKLFNGVYDHAPKEARPKYGLFNVWGDPSGPKCEGNQYGDCFMVFSPELRQYATMTPFDSSGIARGDCKVCTVDDGISKVLSQFKVEGDELENFIDVVTGHAPYVASDATYYKEMQLHCGVFFQEHVTHIVIADKYLSTPANLLLLYNFALKNGCYLVSTAAMKQMADARLKSREELATLVLQHAGAVITGSPRSQLLCGPMLAENRALFRAYCDAVCREELRRIRFLLTHSRIKTWRASAAK